MSDRTLKAVTEKQKVYAQRIAGLLNIKLPEEETSSAYSDFINANKENFSQRRKDLANAVNILDYARSQGLELKKDGKDYRVKNYSGGFIITPEKNNWNWFGENQGGGVVQLCMFLENKTYQEAVDTLLNEDMESIRRPLDWKPEPEPPKEFNLPPKNDTNKHVYAYLTKTRGIDAGIVKEMLDKGYIYENQQRSCVFVGRDNEGVPRHASVRSTNTSGKAYKKDVYGSQKKFSFSISGTSGTLNVFEAPIDALSYMSMQKMNSTLPNDSYLSLGGVSMTALDQYLETHPEVKTICVCTDGDEAGEKASEQIKEKYGTDYEIIRQRSRHKDFNEDLISIVQEESFKDRIKEQSKIVDEKSDGTIKQSKQIIEQIKSGDYKNLNERMQDLFDSMEDLTNSVADRTKMRLEEINRKDWMRLLKNDQWIQLEQPKELPTEYFENSQIKKVELLYELEEMHEKEIESSLTEQINPPNQFYLGYVNGKHELIFRAPFFDSEEYYISDQATEDYMWEKKSLRDLAINIYNQPDLISLLVDEEHLNHEEKKWGNSNQNNVVEKNKNIESPTFEKNITTDINQDFTGEDFTGAKFQGNKIEEAVFTECNFTDALIMSEITDTQFIRCNFKNAQIQNTIIQYSDLRENNFEGTNFQGVSIKESSLCRNDFLNTQMDAVNLSNNFVEDNINGDTIQFMTEGLTKEEAESIERKYMEELKLTEESAKSIQQEKIPVAIESTVDYEDREETVKELPKYPVRPEKKFYNNDEEWEQVVEKYKKDNQRFNELIENLANEHLQNKSRFSNVGEVAQWFSQNGYVENAIKGIDLKAASDFATAYEKVLKIIPEIAGKLFSSISLEKPHKKNAVAWVSGDRELHLSNRLFKEGMYSEVIKSELFHTAQGYYSKGADPFLHVYIHEMGHSVESVIAEKIGGKEKLWSELGNLFNVKVDIGENLPYISGYGNEKYGDWFAEMFSTYINGSMDKDVLKFGKFIKQCLKGETEYITEQYKDFVSGHSNFIEEREQNKEKILQSIAITEIDDDGYVHFNIDTLEGDTREGYLSVFDPQNESVLSLVPFDYPLDYDMRSDIEYVIQRKLKEEYFGFVSYQNADLSMLMAYKTEEEYRDFLQEKMAAGEGYGNYSYLQLNMDSPDIWKEMQYQNQRIEKGDIKENGDGYTLAKSISDFYHDFDVYAHPNVFYGTTLHSVEDVLDDMSDGSYFEEYINDISSKLEFVYETSDYTDQDAAFITRGRETLHHLKNLYEDMINDTDQAFVLTGKKVSLEMQDILERLGNGEEVSIHEINATKEIQYCRSIADNGEETYLLDGREDKQNQVMEYMDKLGSASGRLDKDGKMIYDGDVRKGSRLDIVIGLPGAGKSSALVDVISQEFHSKVIDNDMAKERFTEYQNGLGAKLVHKESQIVCERALDNALSNHENIVLPKVGSNTGKLFDNIIASAKERGYEINVHFVDLDREKALGRMLGRLINTGRFLDPVLIDKYCPDKENNRCEQSYEALKLNELISGYSRWDNNVGKGEQPYMVECHNLTGEYIDNARVRENEKGVVGNDRIGLRNNGDSRQSISEDMGENGRTAEASVQGVHEGISKDHEGRRGEFQGRPIEEGADLESASDEMAISDEQLEMPEITISNYEQNEKGGLNFDVTIGEEEVHKGSAAFDDDGTVNWVFVEPKPLAVIRPDVIPDMPEPSLQIDWEQLIARVKQMLQDLWYRSKEFMRALGVQTNSTSYTQSVNNSTEAVQQETLAQNEAAAGQEAPAKEVSQTVTKEAETVWERPDYNDFVQKHKDMVKDLADAGKRIPIVINAYGGPGAGKTVSCMDICQQLKKAGYNAEYVQEYAKDLVYDGNMELLDGSEEHQFEMLKEQLHRMDRLYGKVDFIVTDSPLLLNAVYNKELTPEYEKMVDSISSDFRNFTYFVERDPSSFQQEGRIHNLDESQQIDIEIKGMLDKRGIYYGTYRHETIDKVVSNAIRTYGKANHIAEEPSEKQKSYAKRIAETLNLALPDENSKVAYAAFLSENVEKFNHSDVPVDKASELMSYEDYLGVVSQDGARLKEVPKEYYTEELLLAAVKNWGAAVKLIPEEQLNNEIVLASVRQYGTNLKHIPEKYRTQEVCVAAYVSSSGRSQRFTPRQIKEAVKQEAMQQLQKDNHAYPDSEKRLNGQQLQEQGELWQAQIDRMLKEHEADSGRMVEDIAFAARFYPYSQKNIQLMRLQNSNITFVGSAAKFEELGYHVKEGEEPLIARVPVMDKYVMDGEKKRIYAKDYTDEIRKQIESGTLKEMEKVNSFQYAAAFYDISQTDCPPEEYPSVFHVGYPPEMHQNLFDALKEFARSQGFQVLVTDMKSISLQGSFEPDKKVIRINERLEPAMALRTLCQELARGIMHTAPDAKKTTALQKECEADIMSIMLMADFGLSVDEKGRQHLFETFNQYKQEQLNQEEPYVVTLEKQISRVQTKVFRPYIEQINDYIKKYVPAEGRQYDVVARDAVTKLAMLDAAYETNHKALIAENPELFDRTKTADYENLYKQTKEKYRLDNSFAPKLAVARPINNGEAYGLMSVELIDAKTLSLIIGHPELIKQESLPYNVYLGDIIFVKENVVDPGYKYIVTENGLQNLSGQEEPEMLRRLQLCEADCSPSKIDCGFNVGTEYECVHFLLQQGIKLSESTVKHYNRICEAFGYEKLKAVQNSTQMMAQINLASDELSQNNRELVAEYVLRTGNFEKAEKYAERLQTEPETVKQIFQELRVVDAYKYMLWTIADYENSCDIPKEIRLTTGAYNTAAIPVLSDKVHNLHDIDQAFELIKGHGSADSFKLYRIEGVRENDFRIKYVEFKNYEAKESYGLHKFTSYEEAETFYREYLQTPFSRLLDAQDMQKDMAALEYQSNMAAAWSGLAGLEESSASIKDKVWEPQMDEKEAFEALKARLEGSYTRREEIPQELKRTCDVLSDIKQTINTYGTNYFVELANGFADSSSDAEIMKHSVELHEWLRTKYEQLAELPAVEGLETVKDYVAIAFCKVVSANDVEMALNAVDSILLSAEFEAFDLDNQGTVQYNAVLDTLKSARVNPEKYCYVDYTAQNEAYLYTSDPSGRTYKKSLNADHESSISGLNDALHNSGYQICTSFEEFKAHTANSRIDAAQNLDTGKQAYVQIMESSNDMLPPDKVISVYDFKNKMDKLYFGDVHEDITFKLVVNQNGEENVYMDTFSGKEQGNVFEQLYEKVKTENPELSRVISRQYYKDQIDFNQEHLIRPVLQKMRQEEKPFENEGDIKGPMECNDKLKEQIRKLELSPADAELLKLQAGNIQTEQIAQTVQEFQSNQQMQRQNLKQDTEIEMK